MARNILLLCVIGLLVTSSRGRKVHMDNVRTITLRKGSLTTGRRNSPIPQTNCIGGAACGTRHEPRTIQCQNQGSDGYDLQWECKADLDSNIRFGDVSVLCEGYDYPEDPFMLEGSCGIEYTLIGIPQATNRRAGNWGNTYSSYNSYDDSSSGLFFMFIVGIIIFMVAGCCSGGGGGGGTNYGNPPPYTRNNYGGGYKNYGNNNGGFWTGLATGAAATTLYNNRNNRGYGGGYGSGYGGGYGRSTTSSSRPTTRTATGYGGTKRR